MAIIGEHWLPDCRGPSPWEVLDEIKRTLKEAVDGLWGQGPIRYFVSPVLKQNQPEGCHLYEAACAAAEPVKVTDCVAAPLLGQYIEFARALGFRPNAGVLQALESLAGRAELPADIGPIIGR